MAVFKTTAEMYGIMGAALELALRARSFHRKWPMRDWL